MNNRILIFGDSITWGAWDEKGGWSARVKSYADKQALEGKEDYDAVYLLGISGDNTDDLLVRFEAEFRARFDDESNMYLVIAMGTNDSQFEVATKENRVSLAKFRSNLEKIITIADPQVKGIVMVGLAPVDDNLLNPMPWKPTHGYNQKNIRMYDQELANISTEQGLVYINVYDDLSNYELSDILHDGLHPNSRGHELMAKIILGKLRSLEILG